MHPDDFQQAWKTPSSQPRLAIDPELLLNEVRRNQRQFSSRLFWRDIREASIALLMAPLWLFMGAKLALPWTWYLTVPVLIWVAGCMLADLARQTRRPPEPGEPLAKNIEDSLARVNHQIWLLRNVFWWYLLPLALAIVVFESHMIWQAKGDGWSVGFIFAFVLLMQALVITGIYWLNQHAVRSELMPRRAELVALLTTLQDESHSPRHSSGSDPSDV